MVTDDVYRDEYVLFQDSSEEWRRFCGETLEFEVPEDILAIGAEPEPEAAGTEERLAEGSGRRLSGSWVLALYRRYQREGEAFKPGYLRLLAHGGAARPEEILGEAGIDMRDPAFWRGGFRVVEEMIEELEGL